MIITLQLENFMSHHYQMVGYQGRIVAFLPTFIDSGLST